MGPERLDPSQFVKTIDHPYFPMKPGTTWEYEAVSSEGEERIVVTVTDRTKVVDGVTATVVRDTVTTAGGKLVEDTYDWYAQDRDGNVWYLGEDTHEYEHGTPVNDSGSWEAGVDGAQPGIVMLAAPRVRDVYRQEHLAGEAEDMGEVLAVGVSKRIGLGAYDDVVVTRDWTPLEPDVVEEKWYARGIGMIYETATAGGSGSIELIEHTPPL